MKVFSIMIAALAVWVQATTFSVAPALFGVNSAQFALGKGKVQPLLGFDYVFFRLGESSTEPGYSYDRSFNIHLLVPKAGLKAYMREIDKLKTYFTSTIQYIFPIVFYGGTASGSGGEDDLMEGASSFLASAGLGVEYAISEQFSIGSEMVFNLYLNSITSTNIGYGTYSDNFTLGITTTRILINYHFK
jgi:hypothetical protein